MHMFAELWTMRLAILVIISNKQQGMNHFMQESLKLIDYLSIHFL